MCINVFTACSIHTDCFQAQQGRLCQLIWMETGHTEEKSGTILIFFCHVWFLGTRLHINGLIINNYCINHLVINFFNPVLVYHCSLLYCTLHTVRLTWCVYSYVPWMRHAHALYITSLVWFDPRGGRTQFGTDMKATPHEWECPIQ